MKILHFADVHWHSSTLDDLREPTRRILEIAHEEKPDVAVIAGDLTIDRGRVDNSTAVAVRAFVCRLRDLVGRVIILPGNHDITHTAAEPDNVRAILADDDGSVLDGVEIVDRPTVLDLEPVHLAVIPYPSAALFHAHTGETRLQSLSGRLAELAGGLSAQAQGEGRVPLLAYHGTVTGGRMGDESAPVLLTRGEDVALPLAALAGFQGVLAGHLHHPQTIQAPDGPVIYPGCVSPLTYGERTIEPGVAIWDVATDGRVTVDRRALPVTHQRLQIEVGPDDWDEALDATHNLEAWIGTLDPPEGSRVKVRVTAGRHRLGLLTDEIVESIRQARGLHELRIERARVAEGRARLGEGSDRASRVDITETLDLYAAETEDAALSRHLSDVKAISAEVEGEIEQTGADPRYELRPIRLQVENYKSITQAEVDFRELPARWGVFGQTGVGKSNLILAIYWLLYGTNPKSEDGKARTSLGEIVQRGAKRAHGVLEVEAADGAVYRITREVRLSKGRGSSKLFFDRAGGGDTWEAVTEGTARETQARIVELFGPPELYWLTRHLRQHGESAVKLSSARLADAINSTLQLDFESRATVAKRIRDAAQSSGQATRARAEQLTEQLPDEQDLTERKRARDDELEQMEERRAQQAIEIQEHERELEERRDQLSATESRASEAERLRPELAKASAAVAELSGRRREIAQALDQIGEVADITTLHGEANRARDQHRAAADRVEQAREHHAEADRSDAQRLGSLSEAERAAAAEQQAAARKRETAQQELDRAARAASLLDDVPCGGDVWFGTHTGNVDMGACPLLRDARAGRTQLSTLTEWLEIASAKFKQAEQVAGVRSHARAEHERVSRQESEGRRLDVERLVRAEREARAQADAMASKVRELSEAAQRRARIEAEDEALEQRLAEATERLTEVQAQLEGTEAIVQQADHERRMVRDLSATVTRARAAHTETATRIERLRVELEQIERNRRSRSEMLTQLSQLKAEAAAQEHRGLCASYYVQAVQRSGIPSLLLERLAPVLEQRVNEIIAATGRELRIETERVTTTGEARSEVNLQFRSPACGDDWVPIAELSGGEEDVFNAAWAVGLAQTAAEMTGTALDLVVLDEPFTGVSAEYDEAVREVLGAIQRHVSRVCLITHKDDLKPMVDGVVQLSHNGDGVAVEVQR